MLFAIVIGCTSFASLAGCSKSNDLRVFLFAQSHEVEIYEKVIANFTEETGIKIDLTIEEEKYYDLLSADLMSGTAADVFYVRPGDVRAYANQNSIINLSQTGNITEDEVKDVWKQAIDFYRYDGTVNNVGDLYALPKDYSQYVLGFNRKKVQENTAGMARLQKYLWTADKGADWTGEDLTVTDSSGTTLFSGKIKLPGLPGDKDALGNDIVFTYDEFGAIAYLLSDNGQWGEEPLKATYGTAFWEDLCLMAYVWGNDAEFLKDNNTKVNFTDQKFIDAYQGFLDLNSKWYAHAIGSTKTGYELFTEGSLVFYPVGTWDIGYFDRYASTLEYDLMPWPIANTYKDTSLTERQNKWKARVDSIGYGVYSGSEKVEEATQFIKYLSINESVQRLLTESGVQIPNIEKLAKTEYLNNEMKDANGKDLAPRNKQLLLNIAEGSAKNGHYGPTVYTYNTEWFAEFFTGATAKLWEKDTGYTVKSYCDEYAPKSQAKLDEAIQMEKDQKN